MVGIGHNGAPKQSVFRNAKKGKKATLILNSCLQNDKLSLAAKGLLSELLSMPQDWVFVAKNLIRAGCKKDKLYGLIDELITHGYMGREKIRDDKNQFSHFFYWVSDFPFPEYPEMGLHAPHTEKPEEGKNPIKTTVSGKAGNGATSGSTASGKTESGIKKNKLNKDTNKKTSKKDFARESFEKFYHAYPKRTTKAESFKSWEKLSKADQAWAMSSIPEYKKLLSSDGGWRKPLDPVRYLNRRMFEDFQIEESANNWGWWRAEKRWSKLTPEDWRNMIRAAKPNGVWPWQDLGPPPGHPECLLPTEAQDAYGDKYFNQVQELIREHGESVQ